MWSENIKFYIFTSENIKYTFYFINIFLYFMTLYIINIYMNILDSFIFFFRFEVSDKVRQNPAISINQVRQSPERSTVHDFTTSTANGEGIALTACLTVSRLSYIAAHIVIRCPKWGVSNSLWLMVFVSQNDINWDNSWENVFYRICEKQWCRSAPHSWSAPLFSLHR